LERPRRKGLVPSPIAAFQGSILLLSEATKVLDPFRQRLTDPKHQGLILHSVYHRPNGWDHVSPGQKVPNGESSMWGDYHARELALLILREARGEPYLSFFDPDR
ncbi:MAG: hypothetical protein N3I86_14585, partial [Verrucomicrobiae bacterium]|nr:hypothetical protein [Verrucomicrobiae bacterium]